MRRLVTSLTVALVGCALAAGPASAQPAAGAPAPATSAAGVDDTALAGFGSCLLGRQHGDVLLIVDSSGSLRTTDPDAARVAAARFLAQRFVEVAQRSKLTLDLAVSDFAATYEPILAWTRLTPAAVRDSVSPALDRLAGRDDGFETDYWTALNGARQQLGDKAKTSGGPDSTCQIAIWVTDGKYELSPRTTKQESKAYGDTKPYAQGVTLGDDKAAAAAAEAGKRDLCRSGGLADEVRSSGIRTLAVGLETPTAPGAFDFLKAVATGQGTPARCGAITTPTPGDFVRAGSIDDLLFVFNRTDPKPPVDVPSTVCTETAQPSCTVGFVLDASIQSVRALAGTELTGVDVQVRGPGGGTPTTLTHQDGDERRPPRKAVVDGLPIQYQWRSPRTVEISMTRQPGRVWTGRWSIAFVSRTPVPANTRARTQLDIEGDLVPAWLNPPKQLRAGRILDDVRLGVVRAGSGEPVAVEDILGTVLLSATLDTADSTTAPVATDVPKSELGQARSLDLRRAAPGRAVLRLRLQVTTAGLPASGGREAIPGTELTEQVKDVPVTIYPPANLPDVSISTVDFGQAEDLTPLTATVRATGSGCLWLAGSTVLTAPLDVTAPRVATDSATTRASCLPVPAGGQVELPVSITRSTRGIGTINGSLRIGLASRDAGPLVTSEVTVPFTASVTRSPRGPVRWAVFIGGLLFGLLLPVAVAYLAKWYAARIPGMPLVATVFRVSVEGGEVRTGGRSFELHPADAQVPVSRSGVRRLLLPEAGVELRTRTGLNPATPGHVRVDAAVPAASGTPPYVMGDGRTAQLPLAVHNTWVVLVDGPGDGDLRLLTLTSAVAGDDVLGRLSEQIRSELPRRVAALRTAGRDHRGDAAGDEEPQPDREPPRRQPRSDRSDDDRAVGPWSRGRRSAGDVAEDVVPRRRTPWSDDSEDNE